MSCCDSSKDLEIPCPFCGGVVFFWYTSPGDCSAPASGRSCKKCKKSFSDEKWDRIERTYNAGKAAK